MSDALLSLARMARRLGVTQAWLKAEAQANRVPSLPAGNRYLFSPEAVEQALARRAAEVPASVSDAPRRKRGDA